MVHSAAGPATRQDNGSATPLQPACGCETDHFVQFYEEDAFLVSSLAKYASDALNQAATVLLIGTSDHLGGVAERLRESGHSLSDLVGAERVVLRDAKETLGLFMVNGQPDRALFERHVGGLVGRLLRSGRPLHAFGEMVALLWADGQCEAALSVEALWNELGRSFSFQLFCAYPLRGFARAGDGHRFRDVCQSHRRVLPAETFIPPIESTDEQLRAIAMLQQKAAALAAEIAERQKAEAALRRREAELTSFLETASIALHWVNADGIITWANAAELELLGYAKDDYIGRHIADFHGDRAVIDDILARLSRGERIRDREAKLRCKDGSLKTVLIDSSVLWEDGRFVHTQCFTRDVTQQRRAEQELRGWAAIAQCSDDAIFSLDPHSKVTSWNAGAQRLFGYPPQEVIGQRTKIIPADKWPEEEAVLARLRRGERVDHYETVRQRRDGGLIDVSITVSALRDGNGAFVGVAKVARDISEKKRAEDSLRKAREELSAANAALEQQLTDLRQLQELSWRVYGAEDRQTMLDELLRAVLAVHDTDRGLISLIAPNSDGVLVAASAGFDSDFRRAVEFVPAGQGACGWCFLKRTRVVVEDVHADPLFEPYRSAVAKAGFRAVHSTPLLSRDGRLIGVLSVHFSQPRRPRDREIRLMDLYARHAADVIENHRLRDDLQRELAARTATAEELRVTTERFQLAAHGRTLTLFEQDLALRYRWLYPAHPEHAGAVGRTDDEILGSAGAQITAIKKEVIATGLTRQAEVYAPLPDGDRCYDLTVLPKRDQTGAIIGVAGAAFDITERKQAEQALRAAKEETALANRDLERRVQERTASLTDLLTQMESFSYAVSHDLRSPLRAMAGYAAVLKSDHSAQLDADGRELLDRIIRSSERMSKLINDVLAYARVNRDRLELTPVALGDCLKNVVQHAPEFQSPRADLIVRGDLPCVLGNEAFVTQILTNLLGNAVKFVAPGRTPRVELTTETLGNRLRLSIRDNGIGIKADQRERLFGLFERLNVDKRYEGTGMGLAIVRRALERMGGSVTVDSDGETGSCFIIEMALAEVGVQVHVDPRDRLKAATGEGAHQR